ncbi:MAG: TolC family protein [Acidobacteriota bacterium]|nr:TolC family protein [Acidobacteriota bacterium]
MITKAAGALARPFVAAFLAVLIAGGNVNSAFAKNPAPPQDQQPPPAGTPGNVPPASQAGPEAAAGTTPAPAPPIPVSLGLSKHSFVNGPRVFPTLIAPYVPIHIDEPNLVNSPRIDQLIHDGKLEITLQDAVELALENSLDIAIARYTPWIADTDILRTKAGGRGLGTTGADFGSSQANITPTNPQVSYDPIITATASIDSRTTAVNNPFLSGTGVGSNTLSGLHSHATVFNVGYSQSFSPGTTINLGWNNARSSSGSSANFFNPSVQSALFAGFSQQLLNGFGSYVGRRNIMISKNNRKIADLVFMNQAITTVTNTINAYWELVYARENVKVQQQAVAVSDKLYNDNKKQLEIGTMAPLDVTRAESEVAAGRQNLIVAQTTKLQDEQILKNAMSKNPLAPNLINVEIIPKDLPAPIAATENSTFEAAIQEAFNKRPDLREQEYNLKNAGIEVRATRNALLPELTLSGQYSSSGLAGNSPITGTSVITAGAPIVDSTGAPVTITGPGGVQTPIFQQVITTPLVGTSQQGFTTAQNQVFTNQFPDYFASLNLFLPLRNRSAQADNARALLVQRQIETQFQQLKNAALLDVRNTYIALQQDRARVDAAIKARELQKQTFEAEQKKYTLGASTVYQVILTQRDYVTAQGVELRALSDLVEAKANFERAVGRTLDVNRVTIASTGTKSGGSELERETLIPGTLHGQVVGSDKIFTNANKANFVAPAKATE